MKLLSLIMGLSLGLLNGLVVGAFTGNYYGGIVFCTAISCGLSLLLSKNEIINPESLEFKSKTAKMISSNTWVFWLASFLSALIASVIFEDERLHVFFIIGLSGLWGLCVPPAFAIYYISKEGDDSLSS